MVPVVAVQFTARQRPRANQRHLATENVPELRQFVDGMPAAKRRKPAGHARIHAKLVVIGWVRHNVFHPTWPPWICLSSFPHGPEFPRPERFAITANAQMGYKGRALR